MKDGRKSKGQLIQELTEARKRIDELEEYTAGLRMAEQASKEKERTAELEKQKRLLENEIILRRQMNRTLQESEAKYRFLTEKMSDVIWIADTNLNITYISPSIERIRGYTPEERIQLLSKEAMTPESYARALETFQMGVERDQREGADPERSVHIELEFYHKNGSTVWMDNVISAIYDDSGKIIGIHGVGRDITERKKAEEEKKRLENQLIQIQKIEALDRFAGGIAHDLNNILYPVIINTEQLVSEIPSGSGHSEILNQNLKALYRQKDLIKKILTFSREHSKNFSPTKIVPLVEETTDLVKSSLPSSIDIRYHADVDSDTIMGDATQIQQVVMNLCRNAADALESDKGTIEVRLKETHVEPMSDHHLAAGSYFQLTVEDTGCGMSPHVMDRIFEPFFTTKGIGRGTGMGLSVVHGIVKNHGGAVTVRSEEGKGSLFTVYLPVCDERCQAQASFPDHGPLVQGRANILLIDDEDLILLSLQRALRLFGYRVVAVKDGLEALRLFEKKPDGFDLVITDLTMPGMTGVELSRRILGIRSDLPVILCTGFNDDIESGKVKSLGIRELIRKPVGTGELKDVIRRALENRYG